MVIQTQRGLRKELTQQWSLIEDDFTHFSGIVPLYIVRKPVHSCWKAVVNSMVEFTPEVSEGIFFRYGQQECFPQVTNVIKWPQFREASRQHHDEQVDQKWALTAQYEKSIFTKLFKPKEGRNTIETVKTLKWDRNEKGWKKAYVAMMSWSPYPHSLSSSTEKEEGAGGHKKEETWERGEVDKKEDTSRTRLSVPLEFTNSGVQLNNYLTMNHTLRLWE